MSARLKKLMLFLATAVACLILAEAALRLAAPVEGVRYALDEVYLHRLVPSQRAFFTHDAANGGRRIEVRVNSRGFRGPEFAREPAPGTRRVVVYGDSFVMAEYTPLEESFTGQLGRILNEGRAPFVEVLNAGVNAYGPDQISRRIPGEVDELKPDLVVLALFSGNDYGDLLRNKLYRLGPDGEAVPNAYTISPTLRASLRGPRSILLLRLRQALRRAGLFSVPARDDAPRESLIERSLRRCREQYADFVVAGDNEVRDLQRDQYDADISLMTDADAAAYKKRLMEGVLRKIKRDLDARGVPFLVVIIPAASDLIEEHMPDRAAFKDYDPTALTRTLKEIADRNEIRSVNLFEAFRQSDPATLYFKLPNLHWNERGQALAASLSAEQIFSGGLLD